MIETTPMVAAQLLASSRRGTYTRLAPDAAASASPRHDNTTTIFFRWICQSGIQALPNETLLKLCVARDAKFHTSFYVSFNSLPPWTIVFSPTKTTAMLRCTRVRLAAAAATSNTKRTSTTASGGAASKSASYTSASTPPRLAKTPFEALGLDVPTAVTQYTAADIKAAYKRTALKVHPDVPGGNQARFVQAQKAAAILERHPNDTTSWVGTDDFPGGTRIVSQPASSSNAKPTSTNSSAANSSSRDSSATETRRTSTATYAQQSNQQQQQRRRSADEYDFSRSGGPASANEEQRRAATDYSYQQQQSAAYRGPSRSSATGEASARTSSSGGDSGATTGRRPFDGVHDDPAAAAAAGAAAYTASYRSEHENRHWVGEMAARYYAMREGRYSEYMHAERFRRERVRSATMASPAAMHNSSTGSGGYDSDYPDTVYGTSGIRYSPIFALNSAVGNAGLIWAIGLFFYTSYERSLLSV